MATYGVDDRVLVLRCGYVSALFKRKVSELLLGSCEAIL